MVSHDDWLEQKAYSESLIKLKRPMQNQPDRRSFLALTSASTIGALAGCSNVNSQPQTEENGGDSAENQGDDSDTTATLTVQVQPDQEELTTLQEDLQQEIEDGEITQEEAQQKLQSKQVELTEKAVISYEETAANDDTISVEKSESEYGMLQVNAPTTTLVSTLQNGEFAALLPEEYYEQFIQQQEQQQAMQEQMEEQQENSTSGNWA